MKKREWAKEYEQKEEERREHPGTPFFRSYYNGYSLKEEKSEDGLERNEFVYSGLMYCFQGTVREKNILKIVHAVLAAVSCGMLILCGFQGGEVNASKIFALPFFACAVMTVLRIFAVIFYLMSPLDMREWDYVRAVKRYKIFTVILTICALSGLVISIILAVLFHQMDIHALISCLSFFVIAVCSTADFLAERKKEYIAIPASSFEKIINA